VPEGDLAEPQAKLADSLNVLRSLQEDGRRVFRSREFARTHRERLLQTGFLQQVIKGWLISTSPDTREGDSTPWFASFWEFCGHYCRERYGDDWHLSPEQSLLLHAGNTVIPRQVIIYSPKGTNNTIELLFDTSVYDLKHKEMPPRQDIGVNDGLRLISAPAALVKVPESFYRRFPIEAQVVLAGIADSTELLRRLIKGGHSVVAGRLVGALRRLGKNEMAEDIAAVMKSAGYTVRESDPFDAHRTFTNAVAAAPPIVARIRVLWESNRCVVKELFPPQPGLPDNRAGYIKTVDDLFTADAYRSLSIEGYRVTPGLVDRVREGAWNPDHHDADRESRDALAARGYWQAFQRVKADVENVLAGDSPGNIVQRTHRDWYRELFQPCVAAGIINAEALAGYRNDAVFLRASRHVPPRWEAVRDAMPALFNLIAQETEPSVRAVLGHWLFGYIHPYPDGNGRMARFLMNVMLASGGYPWTVIRVEDRDQYLSALESASVDGNLEPFTRFIAATVQRSNNEIEP
jgi:fido (protein-threonine AMPylation protein)